MYVENAVSRRFWANCLYSSPFRSYVLGGSFYLPSSPTDEHFCALNRVGETLSLVFISGMFAYLGARLLIKRRCDAWTSCTIRSGQNSIHALSQRNALVQTTKRGDGTNGRQLGGIPKEPWKRPDILSLKRVLRGASQKLHIRLAKKVERRL